MQEPRRTRPQQGIVIEAEGDGARPGSIFRLASFGMPRFRVAVTNNAPPPEPEELEGSELTDAERNAAIARERTRREGKI